MTITSSTRDVIESALDDVLDLMVVSGLVPALRKLTQDVWRSCLDRYEPDELGDTHMSLGIQASENLFERAQRRYGADPRERSEDHWHMDGLSVTTPRKVLTLEVAATGPANGDGLDVADAETRGRRRVRLLAMKTPMAEARTPRWDLLTDWDHASHARYQAATSNSYALGGYLSPAPGQDELFEAARRRVMDQVIAGDPDDLALGAATRLTFMWLWSGEPEAPLTSGWLGVPILGETPFAGTVRSLWRDEDTDTSATQQDRQSPDGPSFDERPVATTDLTLRRRAPGAEEA